MHDHLYYNIEELNLIKYILNEKKKQTFILGL